MIVVGFTGTQRGMRPKQLETCQRLLHAENPKHLHHGVCIGADHEVHILAYEGLPRCTIHLHPAKDAGAKRAPIMLDEGDPRLRVYAEAPPLVRNHHIVDASGLLIATPHTFSELMRSGTWATIRYARKQGVKCYIIWPDGTWEVDGAH